MPTIEQMKEVINAIEHNEFLIRKEDEFLADINGKYLHHIPLDERKPLLLEIEKLVKKDQDELKSELKELESQEYFTKI